MNRVMLRNILNKILLLLFSFIPFFTSCEKEYSYEGGPTPIVLNPPGSSTPAAWSCPACKDKDVYEELKWSFFNNTSFYCGIIDTAIATPERNGFTFFGPSSCSADSGMVITVYLQPVVLNRDLYNITTAKVGFYYYDNAGQTHPFITRTDFPFSLTIESYIHQAKLMTGRFGGTVFRPNGEATILSSGKFKVRIL
jgi:hypothetical protein